MKFKPEDLVKRKKRKTKFRNFFSRKLSFHLRLLPEFVEFPVEWCAFRKCNRFWNFWKLLRQISVPYIAASKFSRVLVENKAPFKPPWVTCGLSAEISWPLTYRYFWLEPRATCTFSTVFMFGLLNHLRPLFNSSKSILSRFKHSMRLVQFFEDGRQRVGVEIQNGGDIMDISAGDPSIPSDMKSFLEGGEGMMLKAKRCALHFCYRSHHLFSIF